MVSTNLMNNNACIIIHNAGSNGNCIPSCINGDVCIQGRCVPTAVDSAHRLVRERRQQLAPADDDVTDTATPKVIRVISGCDDANQPMADNQPARTLVDAMKKDGITMMEPAPMDDEDQSSPSKMMDKPIQKSSKRGKSKKGRKGKNKKGKNKKGMKRKGMSKNRRWGSLSPYRRRSRYGQLSRDKPGTVTNKYVNRFGGKRKNRYGGKLKIKFGNKGRKGNRKTGAGNRRYNKSGRKKNRKNKNRKNKMKKVPIPMMKPTMPPAPPTVAMTQPPTEPVTIMPRQMATEPIIMTIAPEMPTDTLITELPTDGMNDMTTMMMGDGMVVSDETNDENPKSSDMQPQQPIEPPMEPVKVPAMQPSMEPSMKPVKVPAMQPSMEPSMEPTVEVPAMQSPITFQEFMNELRAYGEVTSNYFDIHKLFNGLQERQNWAIKRMSQLRNTKELLTTLKSLNFEGFEKPSLVVEILKRAYPKADHAFVNDFIHRYYSGDQAVVGEMDKLMGRTTNRAEDESKKELRKFLISYQKVTKNPVNVENFESKQSKVMRFKMTYDLIVNLKQSTGGYGGLKSPMKVVKTILKNESSATPEYINKFLYHYYMGDEMYVNKLNMMSGKRKS